MRSPPGVFAVAMIIVLLSGCSPRPSPPASPGPPQSGAAAEGVKLADLEWVVPTAQPPTSGVNQIINGSGSHTLKVTTDLSTTSNSEGERQIVQLGGRNLVIEFDTGRVLLDGTERANFPVGTKELAVQYVGGKFSMTADGTPVMPPGAAR